MLPFARLTLDLLFTISLHRPTSIFMIARSILQLAILCTSFPDNIIAFQFFVLSVLSFGIWGLQQKLLVVGSYFPKNRSRSCLTKYWENAKFSKLQNLQKIRQCTLRKPLLPLKHFQYRPKKIRYRYFSRIVFSPRNFVRGQCHLGNLQQYLTNSKHNIFSQ